MRNITRPPRPFEKTGLDNLYLDGMDTDFTVTLTGMQWHCLMTKLADMPLTPLGHAILTTGAKRMVEQLRNATSEERALEPGRISTREMGD